jgi:hypothetical protein
MSIHDTLLKETVDDYIDLLYDYGCNRPEIKTFLMTPVPFLDRQQRAIKIIEGVLAAHGKEKLLCYLAELARVEHGIRELEPWVRDHVVHAVLSFILGAYINERFLKTSCAVDRFQWKIAGLLHDVGYPVQIASDILRPFEDTINGIKRDLGVAANEVRFLVVPENLETLVSGISGLDLIQNRLDDWNLQVDVRLVYQHMVESGRVCHGMISGLAVLWVIDLMYQKFNPIRQYSDIYQPDSNINWNQTYFEDDVVSACSAIFIHNLDNSHFSTAKIDRRTAPLAFLLKLSDSLQDWERPSLEDPNGIPAAYYDVEVRDGEMIFKANVPSDRKQKIRREISSCLIADDIRII